MNAAHSSPAPGGPPPASGERPAALVLASTSRYRAELLGRLGLAFEVLAPSVDETPADGETPSQAARRLALAKASAVAARRPDAVVIGSDQTATLDGRTIIGKPGDHAHAVEQLRSASGRTMSFHTGIAVVCRARGFERVEVVDTLVRFRELDDARIDAYLAREPAYDCAGSAKSEGLGIALIESLDGTDPTALIGLPLIALTAALEAAGVRVL